MSSPPPEEGTQGFERVTIDEMLGSAAPDALPLVEEIRQSGAWSLQIREASDPQPTVWIVLVEHRGERIWYSEVSAGLTLIEAIRKAHALAVPQPESLRWA